MELLLAAVITVLTQGYKWFVAKMGSEKAKSLTLGVVFLLTIGGVAGWKGHNGELELSDTESIVTVFGVAIAYYEIIIKRIFTPIFNKFKK